MKLHSNSSRDVSKAIMLGAFDLSRRNLRCKILYGNTSIMKSAEITNSEIVTFVVLREIRLDIGPFCSACDDCATFVQCPLSLVLLRQIFRADLIGDCFEVVSRVSLGARKWSCTFSNSSIAFALPNGSKL